MEKKRQIVSIIKLMSLLILTISGMAITVASEGGVGLPNLFTGNVMINGDDAPVGAVITAYIDGELRGSFTIETAGEYDKLAVKGNTSDNNSDILFEINSLSAVQTAKWYDYPDIAVRTLDLSAEGLPKNGDINGDGVIDMDDVVYLARHYFFLDCGMFPENEIIYADGDIDCSGAIDMDDVVYLARHYFFLDCGMFPENENLYPCI